MEDGSITSLTAPIRIGSNNWIGNRCSIMKGATLPSYTIVAANSLCNKKYDFPEYSLIAGSPAKLIKTGIYRCLDKEEDEIKAEIAKTKENK
jgi:acetyltransferase-like isoleucine patch superfamily enzyme